MIYLFAKQLFRDRLVALYAFGVLSLSNPRGRKLFPLMNSVSPMLALLVAVLVMQFLRTKRLLWAAAVGVATYGLALFDPMTLIIGLPLLLLVARDVRTERISGRQAIQLAGYAFGLFLAVHTIVVITTNLSVFEAFLVAYRDSREFNTAQQRPYGFWVFHNAKDFLLHHGIVPALLCVSALVGALARSRNAGADGATEPWLSDDVFPLVSFAASIRRIEPLWPLQGRNCSALDFPGLILSGDRGTPVRCSMGIARVRRGMHRLDSPGRGLDAGSRAGDSMRLRHMTLGHRSRAAHAREADQYMKSKPGVWFATHEQIARHVKPLIGS